jgi:hypothetical protein
VRMGGDIGPDEPRADPVTGRVSYAGPTARRAARVSAAAHGGPVLLAAAVWERARPHVSGAAARPLGRHQLGGEPVDLWQVLPEALSGRRFPPLRTPDAERTNLTPPDAAADLAGLAPDARLLTVVGPPGSGKTALCRAYAWAYLQAHRPEGGVWALDLSTATTARDLAVAAAAALGVPLRSGLSEQAAVARVGAALAGRGPTLLLLDPFDALADAAGGTVAAWLRQAPKARFLVASRQRLRVEGEVCHELQPVASDGAPLAEALRGSWERLEPWERAALARCSVFDGGFTLSAAERVAHLDDWPDAPWMLDILESLADRSLLRVRPPAADDDEARFELYAPIAALAAEELDASGARERTEARHRAWAALR